jgi:hypothetical protein
MAADRKDPVRQIASIRDAVNELEIHVRYGLPAIKRIGWTIVVLLALILWRLWR